MHSKKAIWSQISERFDADYIKRKGFKPDRIEAFHGEWMIVFDTIAKDKVVFTRVRAPYVNRDDFKFKIFRSNAFTRGLTRIGLKDIDVGHPEFDHDFIIQGNDEFKLKMMFENPHIRKLLSYQPHAMLQIREKEMIFHKKFPKDVNEIYFETLGVIKDLDWLHDLYDLFAFTLDHLCHIGTAYEDDPLFNYY